MQEMPTYFASLERELQRNPSQASIWNRKGDALYRIERYEEALP